MKSARKKKRIITWNTLDKMPIRILLLLPILPHLFLIPVLASTTSASTRPGRRGHGRRGHGRPRLGLGLGLAFTIDVDVGGRSIEGRSGRWRVV